MTASDKQERGISKPSSHGGRKRPDHDGPERLIKKKDFTPKSMETLTRLGLLYSLRSLLSVENDCRRTTVDVG